MYFCGLMRIFGCQLGFHNLCPEDQDPAQQAPQTSWTPLQAIINPFNQNLFPRKELDMLKISHSSEPWSEQQ